MKNILFLFIFLIAGSWAVASDHIDGAPTLSNGQADLSDLYAFPTPGKTNSLTLILNTYPGVKPSGHFSKKVKYEIEMRQAEAVESDQTIKMQSFDVFKIQCAFTDPGHHQSNALFASNEATVGTCQLLKDGEILSEISGTSGSIHFNNSFKFFAGPRTDAFFLTVKHFQGVTERKGFPESDPGASNAMNTINILSMAFEIDFAELGLNIGTLAISAQSLDAENNTSIDRVGRPEVTNLSLHAYDGAEPLKRIYNKLPQFAVAQSFKDKFQQRLTENITAYDQMDQQTDWSSDRLSALTSILVEDALVIDLNGTCSDETNDYLAIEKSLLNGEAPTSCGGRSLSDDIMASMYALYIGGPMASAVEFATGVNEPYYGNDDKELSDRFPYLATPGKTSFLQGALLKILIMGQE